MTCDLLSVLIRGYRAWVELYQVLEAFKVL
jgi:hypothetical protein